MFVFIYIQHAPFYWMDVFQHLVLITSSCYAIIPKYWCTRTFAPYVSHGSSSGVVRHAHTHTHTYLRIIFYALGHLMLVFPKPLRSSRDPGRYARHLQTLKSTHGSGSLLVSIILQYILMVLNWNMNVYLQNVCVWLDRWNGCKKRGLCWSRHAHARRHIFLTQPPQTYFTFKPLYAHKIKWPRIYSDMLSNVIAFESFHLFNWEQPWNEYCSHEHFPEFTCFHTYWEFALAQKFQQRKADHCTKRARLVS